MIDRVERHLSILRLHVDFEGAPNAAAQLAWAWRAAEHALLPPRAEAGYRVAREGAGFAVANVRGGEPRHLTDERDVVPYLEAAIYADLAEAHRRANASVLHGALVVLEGRPYALLGASGAGKSALARAAIDAGAVYLGDEHVIVLGEQVLGLPRAVHLDPVPLEAPPLPWHRGADRTRYVYRAIGGALHVLPLVAVPEDAVPRAPVPRSEVVVVHVARGDDDGVRASSALEALRALAEATHEGGDALALARGTGFPGLQLTWRDPAAAIARLAGPERPFVRGEARPA